MTTKRKRRAPAPSYAPPPRPDPQPISREAALDGHARRLAEYATLGPERGPDVAAQSREAARRARGGR